MSGLIVRAHLMSRLAMEVVVRGHLMSVLAVDTSREDYVVD